MPDTGCETGANYKVLEGPPVGDVPESNKKLVLFIGPQTSSFQHFFDRQPPDIAQASPPLLLFLFFLFVLFPFPFIFHCLTFLFSFFLYSFFFFLLSCYSFPFIFHCFS